MQKYLHSKNKDITFAPMLPCLILLNRRASPDGAFFVYFSIIFFIFSVIHYLCDLILFQMERVNFYLDGFNWYYGLRRLKATDSDWQKFYWLDYVKLFQHFIGDGQVLQKVFYFTAPPLKIQKSNRQGLLLDANKVLNGNRFEVVKGQFYEKELVCPVCNSTYKKPEEKRTDVNIAVQMMGDCALDDVDTLVLVCADSDLIPPLQFIKKYYPVKKIRVYFPPDNYSGALRDFMKSHKSKVVRLEYSKIKFLDSIMPDVVTEKNGKSYTIPSKWKIT